jgi:hypothetical protein
LKSRLALPLSLSFVAIVRTAPFEVLQRAKLTRKRKGEEKKKAKNKKPKKKKSDGRGGAR